MAITSDDVESTKSTITAEIAVRVPAGSDVDLGTEAERRVAGTDGVQTATVEGLAGVEPRLSAIVATVTVTIESTVAVERLRDRLSDAVYVDAIERVAQTAP